MDKNITKATEENFLKLIREYNQSVNILNQYQGGYVNLRETDIVGFTVSGLSFHEFEQQTEELKEYAREIQEKYGGGADE